MRRCSCQAGESRAGPLPGAPSYTPGFGLAGALLASSLRSALCNSSQQPLLLSPTSVLRPSIAAHQPLPTSLPVTALSMLSLYSYLNC